MQTEIVREFTTAVAGQWFVETTAPARQPTPSPTNEELRRAFADFLGAMPDEQRKTLVAEMQPGRRHAPRRQLDTSPEAVEAARRLFGF